MLHRRVGAFREHLLRDFRRQAEKEIGLSAKKIQEIIESPLQIVREEQKALAARREELAKLDERAATPRQDLASTDAEPERL
jgi:ribosomal protein S21